MILEYAFIALVVLIILEKVLDIPVIDTIKNLFTKKDKNADD
jgi:hypothetical protein